METYTCEECGFEFTEDELDRDSFNSGDYYCKRCADFLMDSGWDAVDPNHEFDSFSDWDERGH